MVLAILALIFVLVGLKAVIEWTVSLVKWLDRIGGKR